MKQTIGIVIAGLAIALSIAGVGIYATAQFTSIKETEVRNQAMFQCASISSYTTEDEAGASVSYPVEDVYAKCLAEKEIK